MDTGLHIRSIRKWAELLPDATILLIGFSELDDIIENCQSVGFKNIEFVTPEMVTALTNMEANASQALQSKILEQLCLSNELHDAHKAAFSEFKSCNRGKDVVIAGTGPTLSYYSQIPGIPHIGVNSSFLKENLKVDYYFVSHYKPEWHEKLKEYSFTKFFYVGSKSRKSKDQIPEYIIKPLAKIK